MSVAGSDGGSWISGISGLLIFICFIAFFFVGGGTGKSLVGGGILGP